MTAAATSVRRDLEAWKNETAGVVVLRKLDHRGELNKVELVRSGQTIHLSEEERRMNQELVATAAQDSFRNGVLTPVRILSGASDAAEIASNPNLMSEGDMRTLVGGHPKTFEKRLGEIANVTTLQRLLVIAQEEDASFKRVESIKARISTVNPALVHEISSSAPPEQSASTNKYGRSRGTTPQ